MHERLAAFIFTLARDKLPFGEIEELVRQMNVLDPVAPVDYVDGAGMGEWAREAAARLVPPDDRSAALQAAIEAHKAAVGEGRSPMSVAGVLEADDRLWGALG